LPHITIEYMIMVPVLILQIFLFPYAAQVIMNTWEDSRIDLQLEEIVGHLGSSVQQMYYTMNREVISIGSLTLKLDTPPSIVESSGEYGYTITLRNATIYADNEHAQIMNITVSLVGAKGEASTLVTLGENADWNDSSFSSYNVSVINATRTPNLICLSFEEG
jgi:hypothetical protein